METVHPLILDLLEWIGPNPRAYAETLEAWRTSCPRLPVWEDANDMGLITRHRATGRGALISVSRRRHGAPPQASPSIHYATDGVNDGVIAEQSRRVAARERRFR
jgi:hypothetical protein